MFQIKLREYLAMESEFRVSGAVEGVRKMLSLNKQGTILNYYLKIWQNPESLLVRLFMI